VLHAIQLGQRLVEASLDPQFVVENPLQRARPAEVHDRHPAEMNGIHLLCGLGRIQPRVGAVACCVVRPFGCVRDGRLRFAWPPGNPLRRPVLHLRPDALAAIRVPQQRVERLAVHPRRTQQPPRKTHRPIREHGVNGGVGREFVVEIRTQLFEVRLRFAGDQADSLARQPVLDRVARDDRLARRRARAGRTLRVQTVGADSCLCCHNDSFLLML